VKLIKFLTAILVIAALSACSSSRVITAWKNDKRSYDQYGMIMVAGITGAGNDSFRIMTEKYFTAELRALGYNAVSAHEEFGTNGLANLTREETYIRLCEKDIDAVITIALVDRSKEKEYLPKKSYGYPNNYYFTRMLNYKNIQPDSSAGDNKPGYFWESILFDLRTLEAAGTVQTPTFTRINSEKFAREFEKRIIRKMMKTGILTVQKPAKKAF
jgi:hypothetical protein